MPEPISSAAREFGDRVRAERLKLGISQETLAELTGIHWTALGKVERGQRNPSLHSIVRIATGLDIDPAVLLRGLTDSMLPLLEKRPSRAELIREDRERRSM
ncbi:MAG: helix-turn-helix domain-containing protein [Lacisediminihabitans sp.]